MIRGGDGTIEEVSDMYEHARFETKVHTVLKYVCCPDSAGNIFSYLEEHATF